MTSGFFLFIIFFLFISANLYLYAQERFPNYDFSFHGVSESDAIALKKIISKRQGEGFSDGMLTNDWKFILEYFFSDGYLQARIDSVAVDTTFEKKKLSARLYISKGKRPIIKSILFTGDSLFTNDELLFHVGIKEGDQYDPRGIEEGIQNVLKHLENKGYPLASIRSDEITFRQGSDELFVTIPLHLDSGPLVTITELKIEGNTHTKQYVIERELRLRKNQIYSPNLIDDIQRRLMRMQVFSSVSRPDLYVIEEGRSGLSIKVSEGKLNNFDGIVGYIPKGESGRGGYVMGLVDAKLRNLFGTGRRVSTRWHRIDELTQEIEFKYFEPWVASLPVNAEGAFLQRKQDSSYIRRQFGLNVSLLLSHELNVGLSYQRNDIFPGEQILNISKSSTQFLGVLLNYDSRDDRVVPGSGINYSTSYEYGSKQKSPTNLSENSTTFRIDKITFDLEYYLSPFNRQTLMFGLHGKDYRSTEIEMSDLFRVGGVSSIRGYRESQFSSSRIAWTNIEYRWLLGGRTFLFGFVDAGHIFGTRIAGSSASTNNLSPIGYGVGTQLETGIGLIGVSLGLGKEDTFSTAKLHFRLINEF